MKQYPFLLGQVGQIISVFKDLIISIVALGSFYIGYRGLNTWFEQHSGTLEYDAAKSVLKAIIHLRESIKSLRSRGIWPYEFEKAEKENKDESINQIRLRYKVYEQRWECCHSTMIDLENAIIDAEVYWGTEINDLMTSVRRSFYDLRTTLADWLDAEKERDVSTEETLNLRKKFFGKKDESDILSIEFKQSLMLLENKMRMIMSGVKR